MSSCRHPVGFSTIQIWEMCGRSNVRLEKPDPHTLDAEDRGCRSLRQGASIGRPRETSGRLTCSASPPPAQEGRRRRRASIVENGNEGAPGSGGTLPSFCYDDRGGARENARRCVLFACGLAAPLLYVLAVVLGGALRPGHSHLSMPISQLIESVALEQAPAGHPVHRLQCPGPRFRLGGRDEHAQRSSRLLAEDAGTISR